MELLCFSPNSYWFLLVESSMYVLPYIEGLKDLELVAFGFGIFLLVAVIILLTKTKKHTD